MTLYIASKAKHGHAWRGHRDVHGWPIISTWIDEADQGETGDWADLWTRCVTEAAAADVTLVVVFAGEVLKGALVEVGAALGAGRPVHVLDPDGALDGHSWLQHPLVTVHRGRVDAWEAVLSISSAAAEISDGEALATYRAETRRLRAAIDAEADYHDDNRLHHFATRLRRAGWHLAQMAAAVWADAARRDAEDGHR